MTDYLLNPDNKSIKNRNNISDSNINSNETEQLKKYRQFYSAYLFNLLPSLYREYDTDNMLKSFLDNIANQAAILKQDIDNLERNFFIHSCENWVINYLADLNLTKVISNSSQVNRLAVKNMIKWRKLKGTSVGLTNVVNDTVMRNCILRENFEYISFSEDITSLSSPAKNHTFIDLRNQSSLSNIGTPIDDLHYTLNVHGSSQREGGYGLHDLIIYLPRLKVYHLNDAEVKKEDYLRFYFHNIIRDTSSNASNYFPIYDLKKGIRINTSEFAEDPFVLFGKNSGMSIKINGILAAISSKPSYIEVEPQKAGSDNLVTIIAEKIDLTELDPDFVGLDTKEGIILIEPTEFKDHAKQFIIKIYSYSIGKTPVEIGHYDISRMRYSSSSILDASFLQRPNQENQSVCVGTIMLSIEILKNDKDNEYEESISKIFPETIISIRDSRIPQVRKGNASGNEDNKMSKYRNALYIYLPSFRLTSGEKKYLFVDDDGSTFNAKESCNIQSKNMNFTISKMARDFLRSNLPSTQSYFF